MVGDIHPPTGSQSGCPPRHPANCRVLPIFGWRTVFFPVFAAFLAILAATRRGSGGLGGNREGLGGNRGGLGGNREGLGGNREGLGGNRGGLGGNREGLGGNREGLGVTNGVVGGNLGGFIAAVGGVGGGAGVKNWGRVPGGQAGQPKRKPAAATAATAGLNFSRRRPAAAATTSHVRDDVVAELAST